MHTIWSRMLLWFVWYAVSASILCSRRLLQIFVHYGLTMAFFVEDTVSSTRICVRLHSELGFSANIHTTPKPAYQLKISLSYTLAYAIYCGQMMHIQRLRFTLIWTIVRQSMRKMNQVGVLEGVCGFLVWARDRFLRSVCTRLSALIHRRPGKTPHNP